MKMKSFLEEKSVNEFLDYAEKLNDLTFKKISESADVILKLEKMLEYYGFENVKREAIKANDGTYNFLLFVFFGKNEKNKDVKVELGLNRISSRKVQGYFRHTLIYR